MPAPIWVAWPTIVKVLGATGVLISVLILSQTRENLLTNNLLDTETAEPKIITCDERSLGARTADVTILNKPIWAWQVNDLVVMYPSKQPMLKRMKRY